MGVLYANGHGGAQDYDKGREWYQKAADASNAEAKRALSVLREQKVASLQPTTLPPTPTPTLTPRPTPTATIDFTPLYKGEMNLWISSRSENFSPR